MIKMNEIPKQIQTQIFHRAGETDLYDTLIDKHIIENYNFTIDFHQIEPKKINEFIKELQQHYKDLKTYKLLQYNILTFFIKHENFLIHINKELNKTPFFLYAKDLETLEKIFNIFKKYEFKNSPELKIKWTDIVMTARGPSNKTKIYENKDFKDINELYYPFLDLDMFMNEFIFGDENILILCGEPGTGKSKFASIVIKKLLENKAYFNYFKRKEEDKSENKETDFDLESLFDEDGLFINNYEFDNFYYVLSTKNVDIVSGDEFWDTASSYHLIILDDLDFLLSSRDENRSDTQKNQFISNLLSFTDGVQKNKTKIIITTNQPFDTIDDALLRKGRLFSILEFRPLTKKEALKIWESEGLDKKEFNKIFKDYDKIKHNELGHEIQKYRRNKKLIRKKDFILDESIDALRKATTKRAGLI